MGNSQSRGGICGCSDPEEADQSFSNKSKKEGLNLTGNLDSNTMGIHSPKENQAAKVALMKNPVPQAKKTWDDLKSSNAYIKPDLFTDLPILGPYQYPDGSTYYGQYKDSLREGFGK